MRRELPPRVPSSDLSGGANAGLAKANGTFILGRLRSLASANLRPSGLPWPVLGLVIAYFVLLAVRFDRIADGLRWHSDAVWASVLIQRQPNGFGGGETYVGEAAHLSTLALLWLTRSVPFRTVIWEVVPPVVALMTAALLGWIVARISERWAGWLCFAIVAAASPPVLLVSLAQGLKGHTYFGIVALAVVLVLLVERRKRIFDPGTVALATLGSLVGGMILGSDPAFLTYALIPFLMGGLTPWFVDRSRTHLRLGLVVLVVVLGSIGVGAALRAGAYALGFRTTYPGSPYTFATVQQMFTSFGFVVEDVLGMANAYFIGAPLTPRTLLQLVLGAASLLAIPLPVLMAVRRIRARDSNGQAASPATVFLIFWATLEMATIVQFVMSSWVVGQGTQTIRYLVPLFFAVAATVPLWAVEREWRRPVVLGAASLFCFFSAAALLDLPRQQPFSLYAHEARPIVRHGPAILRFLELEEVSHGYAAYWNSHPLTYNSGMRVVAAPVFECRRPSKAVCRFWVNTRSDWYVPRFQRTFLVVQSDNPEDPAFLRAPPSAELGQPAEVGRFGELSVYIYDYDLAERISDFRTPSME